jgi:hypothetical protein
MKRIPHSWSSIFGTDSIDSDEHRIAFTLLRVGSLALCLAQFLVAGSSTASDPIMVGDRRELFVDRYLIDSISELRLQLHSPRDEGIAFRFDQTWEGAFCGYCTVLRDGEQLRLYYRGKPTAVKDGSDEVACVAESADGLSWTRPNLGLVDYQGSRDNNIVLSASQLAHNFAPMLDSNPSASKGQRYKALGGTQVSGLIAFVSADGFDWKKLQDAPVLTKDQIVGKIDGVQGVFDSQNLAFWSPVEKKYIAYFRVVRDKIRRIARAESDDFVSWNNLQLMEYRSGDATNISLEQLYTNQTSPYFRAPHLYLSTAARFMPKRSVLSKEEAEKLGVNLKYFLDTSDAIFQTTRGGAIYDRTFMGAFVRPGIGPQNWVSRTNYPACGIVQTGPTEMSVYLNQDYAQPTAHLHRYSLRLDGFASLHAEYAPGEMVTKPLVFSGDRLLLNYSTSAAGGIRIEIQDRNGQPIPGYRLDDAHEMIGNEIERAMRWKAGSNVSQLAGRAVRLRLVMKDADLYAMQFARSEPK